MKVWQLNVRSQQRKGGKLDPNYLGPYTIVSITGKSVDLQDNQGVIKHKINMDHLMLHSEEKPRIPRKTYEVPSLSTSPQVSSLASPASTAPSTVPAAPTAPAATTTAPSMAPPAPPASTVPASTTLDPPASTAPAATTTAPSMAPPAPPASTGLSTASAATTTTPPASTAPSTAPLASTGQSMAQSKAPPDSTAESTLNTSIIQNVKDAWEGKKIYLLVSKIGPYKLFFSDISNTAPQKEVESEVINAYLTLLVKKFNDKNTERAFVIDSFEMTNIWQQKKPKMKIDPCLYKSFMRLKGLNVSRWACDTVSHPIQQDATSCGIYALKFAECILDGSPVTFHNSAESVNSIRMQIAVCLLENTVVLCRGLDKLM
ncbi:hypothetical protein ILYODFUR_025910 [Ilyodon furcidens]|uniref:Ubiquitin-like protease family profile domain-containing protein n=1 Tax=Ilyodon furcidens TaxID=33524 RepID=A0ABV0T3X6_9TELE